MSRFNECVLETVRMDSRLTNIKIMMSGEDTTTYGQQWDISVFGPGVPRNSNSRIYRDKSFHGFMFR